MWVGMQALRLLVGWAHKHLKDQGLEGPSLALNSTLTASLSISWQSSFAVCMSAILYCYS